MDTDAVSDFLTSLNALTASSSGDYTPECSAEISFVLHQNSANWSEVELTFYQYDSSSCLVPINGETRLLVLRDDIAAIVGAIKDPQL